MEEVKMVQSDLSLSMPNVMELADIAGNFLQSEEFSDEFLPSLERPTDMVAVQIGEPSLATVFVGRPAAMHQMVSEMTKCCLHCDPDMSADQMDVVAWTVFDRTKPAAPGAPFADYDHHAVLLSGVVFRSSICH